MKETRARAEGAQEIGSAAFEGTEACLPGRLGSPARQANLVGKVIALLNQKGGAGKTTLATHLAGELAMQGSRVTLLDADPQGSALDWAQRRLQSGQERLYGVFGLARDTLHRDVPAIALETDYIVIDGPPRVAALARSALLAADLVLIPVQPSAYDVWATQEMMSLIAEARVFRPQLRAAFVINRRVVGTVIGREARDALADQPFPTLRADIAQRIAFADSVAAGRLVRELAPKCAAAAEITTLAQAVREALGETMQ
jgi:chromosome partitioning protein